MKYLNLVEDYKKALQTLKNSLDKLWQDPWEYEEFIKDSVIQRFEYTTELMWKLLKAYLDEVHWLECYSPKSCLKIAQQVWIIDNLEKYFEMIYCRNLSSHIYNENQINEIISQIDSFIPYFQQIYDNITTGNSDN